MVDARTKKKVEATKQAHKAFQDSLKRQVIDVDLTLTKGGEMVAVEPSDIQTAQTEDVDNVNIPMDELVTQSLNRLESAFVSAKAGIEKSAGVFDLVFDPNATLDQIEQSFGTMDRATLEAAIVQSEGIRNSIEYQNLVIDTKRDAMLLEQNRAMLMFETIESQIKLARKANKVAQDHDSLGHEIEMRSLNQETNQLKEADKVNYNSALRSRNHQLSIMRAANVAAWTAKARVAVHTAKAKTNWADRLAKGTEGVKTDEMA